jgi:hypothetical protein
MSGEKGNWSGGGGARPKPSPVRGTTCHPKGKPQRNSPVQCDCGQIMEQRDMVLWTEFTDAYGSVTRTPFRQFICRNPACRKIHNGPMVDVRADQVNGENQHGG